MPVIDEPSYTVVQAASAAGVTSVNTLRSWLQNGVISLGNLDENATQGGTRKLSYRRVLQVAVMVALVDLGVPPARASNAAFLFSDCGTQLHLNGGVVVRLPGELYPEPFTVLIVHPDAQGPSVVWAKPGRSETSYLLTQNDEGMRPGLFLPLDPIVKRLNRVLGLNE